MNKTVTLIEGDGIGKEISEALVSVFKACLIPVDFEMVNAGQRVFDITGELIPVSVYESIERNKTVIKGPITTPIASGFRSINVHLRKKYDLYQNIRPVKGLKNKKIDLVIFRENTEGLYIGEEIDLGNGVTEATKRITRSASYRIIKAAFEYAHKNNCPKVTVVHKANILKITDGLFLTVAREIKEMYPKITYEEMIIDNACMQLVMKPEQFNVIVTMNLYGDILSDLAAGLVGGLGLIPGANIGEEIAIFEPVHGSAPDIAGKNMANPIALIRSACLMLEYLGLHKNAIALNQAINQVLMNEIVLTADLGGKATTKEITEAIIKEYQVIYSE